MSSLEELGCQDGCVLVNVKTHPFSDDGSEACSSESGAMSRGVAFVSDSGSEALSEAS